MQARAYLALQETLQDATFFCDSFESILKHHLLMPLAACLPALGDQGCPKASKGFPVGAKVGSNWGTEPSSVANLCQRAPLVPTTGLEVVPNDGQHVMISIRKRKIKVKNIQ